MAADLILAFDTASEYIALAVGRLSEDGSIDLVALDDHPATRQANVQLMPSVDALFHKSMLSKSDICCVVCGLGPGSFTGVRIGVATAKGIARGLRRPLYGVPTLDAVAWEAWAQGLRGHIGVVADAMRKEVYPARFDLDEAGARRLDAHTVTKAAVITEQWLEAGEDLLVIGDGLIKFEDVFADDFAIGNCNLWMPSGRGLLLAFGEAYAHNAHGSGEAGTLLPIYTRLSDAEENERKRLAGGGQIAQGAMIDVPRSGVMDPSKLKTVVYRPMALIDLDQVSRLEALSFPGTSGISGECWSQDMFAEELSSTNRSWWVAYAGDILAGFAGALVSDGALHILDVSVARPHRRQGIATELLDRLLQDGIDLGAERALLEVRESNEAAQAIYTSLGFAIIGTRPNYYSPKAGAPREAATIMEKTLARQPGPLNSPVSSSDSIAPIASPSILVAPPKSSAAPPASLSTSPARPRILAIETSCDETAAAIIDGDGRLLSDTVASQVDFHARFGGVVPEIASRKHTEAIVGVVDAALEEAMLSSWQELDAIAVTYAPGLIGALVVGVAFAKGIAWATDLPLIRVNHLEGHIYANRLAQKSLSTDATEPGEPIGSNEPIGYNGTTESCDKPKPPDPITPPFIIALLSGGHTMLVHARAWGDYRIMGQTLDDAVGEAFDKIAKALGLGYPGGPIISNLAQQGNPKAIDFPRALLHSHDYRFSLSGLKTAVITYIKDEQKAQRKLDLPNIAASFQQAIIDVQVAKALAALEETDCKTFCIGGGVAANKALRDAYINAMDTRGIHVILPPRNACTDNAAMIARVALDRYHAARFMTLADDAYAQTNLESSY